MSNHLGNVLTVVSDRKIPVDVGNNGSVDYYVADILSANDYYAFGGQMPGRTYNGGNYRYGFNGKENDNEVKGVGNSQDFGERMLDSRLGRWLSIDPLFRKTPHESSYVFASNMPIGAIDKNGDSTYVIIYGAGYLNASLIEDEHDVGIGFKVSAQALKKKIESRSSFDPNRDEVILVYAPTTERFTQAVNTKYKTGKIASLTVFSHGSPNSVSLGGEKEGDKRPDGTVANIDDVSDQYYDYDKREINATTVKLIDKENFEIKAVCTFNGCNIGRGSKPVAQDVANELGLTVKAFNNSSEFPTKNADGKSPIYNGNMIKSVDRKTQKSNYTTFKPKGTNP